MNNCQLDGDYGEIETGNRLNRVTLHAMQVILSADKSKNMSNILDVIQADKNMASMLKSLKAAGLESELNKTGPYTVFAPSELAFSKLPEGALTDWLKPLNKIKLVSILNSHVVGGKFSFDELIDGQKLKTVNGKMLEVKVSNGEVTINGAKLDPQDNNAANGVVHSLDTVISLN